MTREWVDVIVQIKTLQDTGCRVGYLIQKLRVVCDDPEARISLERLAETEKEMCDGGGSDR